ncbi:Uncharacterised protein [Klebsiella pneumoniae]|nr:Uncharacterised protein [Klebsiella pneumoniae]
MLIGHAVDAADSIFQRTTGGDETQFVNLAKIFERPLLVSFQRFGLHGVRERLHRLKDRLIDAALHRPNIHGRHHVEAHTLAPDLCPARLLGVIHFEERRRNHQQAVEVRMRVALALGLPCHLCRAYPARHGLKLLPLSKPVPCRIHALQCVSERFYGHIRDCQREEYPAGFGML